MRLTMTRVPELPTNKLLAADLTRIEGEDGSLDFGFGQTLRFVFSVREEGYEGQEVSVMCSPTLNNRSKLYGILKGLGIEPEEGQEVDIGGLVGAPAKIKVSPPNSKGFQQIVEIQPGS